MNILSLIALFLTFCLPLLLASAGGALSLRAGCVNIALSGMMLMGMFSGVYVNRLVTPLLPAALLSALASGLAGLLFAALLGWAVLRCGARAEIAGMGLNLLALGLARAFTAMGSVSQTLYRANSFLRSTLKLGGITLNGLTLLCAALLALFYGFLYATPSGLRLRASAEQPLSTASLGFKTTIFQWRSLLFSGFFAGIAGFALSFPRRSFGVVAVFNLGIIALALAMVGKRKPLRAALLTLPLALLLAFCNTKDALPSQWPAQIGNLLPFLAALSLVMLTGEGRKTIRASAK